MNKLQIIYCLHNLVLDLIFFINERWWIKEPIRRFYNSQKQRKKTNNHTRFKRCHLYIICTSCCNFIRLI